MWVSALSSHGLLLNAYGFSNQGDNHMDLANMLAAAWYKIGLVVALVALIIFYVMYRRGQT